MALALSRTIRFREEDFGGLVFRKEDNFFFQLNREGYQLINSLRDGDQELAQNFPQFINSAKSLRVLSEADTLDLKIQHNKTSTLTKPDNRRLINGFLRAPLEVGIEITSKCQLSCAHCYGSFNRKQDNELSDEEIFKLIDQLRDIGTFAIFVGGGEPTLHPSFFNFCKYILSKDMNVITSSNGIDVTKEIAQRFADLREFSYIQISLEGPNKKINDAVRGENSFERAITGLKNLQIAGSNPTIGTTITTLNYKSIEDMILLAQELQVPHIHFMNLMPSGRGDKLYEKLKLTAEQRIWLTYEMKRLKDKYKGLVGLDCANFYQQPPSKEFDPLISYDAIDKVYAGCEASRVKAVVISTGEVIGCEVLRQCVAGNIREQSFLDIWENSEVFEKMRARTAKTLEGKCSSCKYLLACVGDCPSYSLHTGKSFFRGGEECPHEPEKNQYHLLD